MKSKILEKSGFAVYPPATRFLLATLATIEVAMMGLNAFTDVIIPAAWLLGPAAGLLTLLTRRTQKKSLNPSRNSPTR